MKNKEMLRKIYYENKAINRNMQRLVNIGLIGILGGIAKEAKASDDPKAKILVKAGMVMIAITEGLLLFSDILDYRKSRIEEKLEKYNRNLLGGLYRENPVKSRNYEAVKSSKKWENVGNSYIIPALLLYRYSYI